MASLDPRRLRLPAGAAAFGLRRQGRADERDSWDGSQSALWPGQQHYHDLVALYTVKKHVTHVQGKLGAAIRTRPWHRPSNWA